MGEGGEHGHNCWPEDKGGAPRVKHMENFKAVLQYLKTNGKVLVSVIGHIFTMYGI